MVPFSFLQPLLKSRVMMRQLMVESLELRAEGAMAQRDAGGAGSLESGALALSCLLAFLMVIPARARNHQKMGLPRKGGQMR